ncbi:MAG: hypothetical protein JXB39_14965 [Deltaproteobacteria bacterium]|nr:hypothetical protein [Deltaproteobacteria bacterium]
MTRILHVPPEEILLDSFRLGRLVFDSGFRPRHMISIWRGGTPIGLGVDAYFRFQGQQVRHSAIATSSYRGRALQGDVVVKGLEHLVRTVCREDGLLLIDDVYESGETIRSILDALHRGARANCPTDIRVATVHRKVGETIGPDLPVMHLRDIPGDVWIDYPHELADLVDDDDPEDGRIREKSARIHAVLRGHDDEEDPTLGPRGYLPVGTLLMDSVRLGVRIARSGFVPDFLVALWPGGVWPGLCIHEVFKYSARKDGRAQGIPDHVPVNTTHTHRSFRTEIVGLDYLAEHVEHHHSLLIVDTVFRSGRMTTDLVNALKDVLRRNLSLSRVRIATVYWYPEDEGTWTVPPFRTEPDWYLRRLDALPVYPHAPHRLARPREDLQACNPDLGRILFG